MHDARPVSRGPEMGRWIMIAVLVLAGIALYFWYAPSSEPAAPPAHETEAP